MKLNTLKGKSVQLDLPQHYLSKLAGRLDAKKSPKGNNPNSKKEKRA